MIPKINKLKIQLLPISLLHLIIMFLYFFMMKELTVNIQPSQKIIVYSSSLRNIKKKYNLFVIICNVRLSKVQAMQNYVDNHQMDFHGYHSIENSRFSGIVDLSF